MKVYLAGPWAERDRAREVAALFIARGHEITHDWWNHDVPNQDLKGMVKCAEDDFKAVVDAEAFFLLNSQPRGAETSGKAVETGIALAYSRLISPKFLLAMGPPANGLEVPCYTNVFHYLSDFTWVDSIEEALDVLAE